MPLFCFFTSSVVRLQTDSTVCGGEGLPLLDAEIVCLGRRELDAEADTQSQRSTVVQVTIRRFPMVSPWPTSDFESSNDSNFEAAPAKFTLGLHRLSVLLPLLLLYPKRSHGAWR